ncbi:GGDEF domain-containing protein [Cupriavidus alkaliphilus]|uniref:EAL domain-containing protein (Putative c-di-GMP-specific phosphodiesterase class I)/GGDEF domain-containing protein n=1 Tax=Cupriavidus alkaliphilus TaxID=942866 RepID=A0A7W4YRX6_9BURK|nr:GGDEF domain-containing protein [Cupriavidus alkaliphilus]MBB3009270.1 EAL domain-containing protein (putative c-di-GMP-specific phosphodiesterase class I)/GGDEF domain-containing protein [Cupriavidus alkaliphilus]
MDPDADDLVDSTASGGSSAMQPSVLVRALTARRAQAGPPATILAIRLDRFANACDTLGSGRADRLRGIVQARIACLLPPGASMHWMAAADLVVITALPAGVPDPGQVASRVADDLSRPFALDGFELHLSCSIGVANNHADVPAERSLQQAFDAMLRVNRQGGAGLARADKPLSPPAAPLLAALPDALERGELSLQLQPRADFAGAAVSGYTVRLRWQHPVLGRVAPQDFLPGVEALGLVGRIGNWLLESVLPLIRAAETIAPLQFTLLATSAQLHRPQMVEALAQALDAAGIAPEHLCIELPASTVPTDADLIDRFAALRRRGLQLALGDFDDSPACREALAALHPDAVTLDARGLGHAREDRCRADSLREACRAARRAGAWVCAKGIETRQQLDAVRAWGCHSVQGYLLAQPFPAVWLLQTHAAIQQRARVLLAPPA